MFIENIRSRGDNITKMKIPSEKCESVARIAEASEANYFERRIIIITTLAQSASFLLHLKS